MSSLTRSIVRPALGAAAGLAAGAAGHVRGGASCHTVPRIDTVNEVASTRWIKLQTLDYTDQGGNKRKWDMATRTTKSAAAGADAVVILALLKSGKSSAVETLLVEQFRPPIGKPTVELPAGLIDKGESAEAAALRELKEETGYHGVVMHVSGEVCMSPGMCDETVKVVVVEVDLDHPSNKSPKQQLEEGEFCVVRRVPLPQLQQELDAKSSCMPIEGLYLMAQGILLGMKMSK